MRKNSNVSIRSLTKDDLELILKWRNHDDISKFMINDKKISLTDHLSWFERNKDNPDRLFFVFECENIPQGYISFIRIGKSTVFEWGFYLKPDAEKGMGILLGTTALNHIFQLNNVNKIFGQVLAFNEKSLKFHARLGFSLEGILRKQFEDERGEFDIHQFGLFKNEWLNFRNHGA
ncbi:UDP-4-amino-4,6-dideoxy-N-acetyl-beta-L-altrosamine N-acetyltransferase [Acinetobacter bereziniae]|uniref:UDP-4-amino-4, 6-dideoxy-N-acetyl-beta-L-altrosamine N-acetyltransferase n=3 Tax=Acinetobacter bereziniae TaxID=106648 RepID=UPI001580F30D|nr:UDP-4-amino-4,6-dideoxy-N-acetyl-beta-L-altrosamine N-acetyltransferase [Acinetobacter bereziniae]NUF65234.1 UDP-4-amino-4,6-dideoxy-N-acetyl-beta-L-altrosamine N-acetyltransferase [Acinetobacter bereziniae]NUG65898.1 UDP-4-amino-4,6-dideoxy-N-acetyl-beta-L-altrosamine N-acetyltransferase [Acinetobacter bereziniae]NUG71798.1 UDP-4-amino-4,6-dideoxy-N-acetyl-beta-L-altrosamine N-acetyltransferase [Acinetobacter bereziniae]WEI22841.1 UDP-4-amino-4,6-dideoxy-N-acetyl-beta-L-altrosamine N-acetyl